MGIHCRNCTFSMNSPHASSGQLDSLLVKVNKFLDETAVGPSPKTTYFGILLARGIERGSEPSEIERRGPFVWNWLGVAQLRHQWGSPESIEITLYRGQLGKNVRCRAVGCEGSD